MGGPSKNTRSASGGTFGSWDAVLQAEADTIDKLSGLIVREIRGIHGVQTTETLVTTNL